MGYTNYWTPNKEKIAAENIRWFGFYFLGDTRDKSFFLIL